MEKIKLTQVDSSAIDPLVEHNGEQKSETARKEKKKEREERKTRRRKRKTEGEKEKKTKQKYKQTYKQDLVNIFTRNHSRLFPHSGFISDSFIVFGDTSVFSFPFSLYC